MNTPLYGAKVISHNSRTPQFNLTLCSDKPKKTPTTPLNTSLYRPLRLPLSRLHIRHFLRHQPVKLLPPV